MKAVFMILLLLSLVLATQPLPDPKPKPDWCHGCWFEATEKCVPSSTRLDLQYADVYCSEDELLLDQKTADSSCENNYECMSNQCTNNTCQGIGIIDSLTMLIQWLAGLLGL